MSLHNKSASISKSQLKKIKVLLIGNSQMGCYDLPQMLAVMTQSAPATHSGLDITACVAGGMGLKKFWESGEGKDTPKNMISADRFDYVIIQEIYNANSDDFNEYAKKFVAIIEERGAKSIVLATASITKYYNEKFSFPRDTIAFNDMQVEFGKKHSVEIATAGYAWLRYLGNNPTEDEVLALYHDDKGHPGAKGTYIYACLLYAYFTKCSPVGLISEFPNIREGITIAAVEAEKLQQAAWEQYQADVIDGR